MECKICKIDLPESAKYCFECGSSQKSFSKLPIILVLITICLAFLVEDRFLGTKPAKFEVGTSVDPKIEALRARTSQAPGDINAWRELAFAAQEKMESDQTYIFDLLEALRGILNINPNDKDALLAMADISYSQQAFDKAAEFYKSYLQIDPENIQVKANYASSLTFLGQFDQSKTILKEILKRDPANFQAGAYLTIAYARNGETEEAKKIGEETMKHAPDDEAIKRFGRFLATLDKDQAKPPASVVESPKGKLLQFFYQHPIVGSKIKSHSFNGDELLLEVENFPMSAMPPNAREAFERKVKAQMGSDVRKVVFLENGVVTGEISP
jgi:cytochrome c-type biogenesis protein CcmH/NrfG